MPSLRCPRCGTSDLHAVEVEVMEINPRVPGMVEIEHPVELACKRCGWTPTAETHPNTVLDIRPADMNV